MPCVCQLTSARILISGTWLVPTQFIGVYYSTMASTASAAPLSKMLQLQKE
jgi:hypothetical protein